MTSPRSAGRLRRGLALGLFAVTISCTRGSSAPTPSSATQPGSSAAISCTLQPVTSIDGIRGNQFAAVAGIDPNDVWAVGSHFEVSRSGPLVQHWDGSTWDTVMQGNQRFNGLQITDVEPLRSDDVWVVGFNYGGASSLRWDGSRWSQISGARGFSGAVFLGVAAVSRTEIWAVGKSTVAGGYDAPIAQRSDGSSWTAVQVPRPASIAAGLRAVSASGPASVWAVGWIVDEHKVFRPLVERWDGNRWTIVPVPKPPTDALLSGVAAVGPNDVWAVGWSWKGDATRSLSLHWDGTTWSRVAIPGDEGASAKLAAVTADGDVVASAGTAPDATGVLRPVVFRFDGKTWTRQAAPAAPSGGGFQGLMLLGRRGTIAVGSQIGPDGYASLVREGC